MAGLQLYPNREGQFIQYTSLTHTLTLEAAIVVANAAVAVAQTMDLKIHVNVTDAYGNVLVYLRMLGSALPARVLSENKAYTAATFQQPTSVWESRLSDRPLLANGLAQHPKVALCAGGVPIIIGGEVVGAVGIAGGSAGQDVAIANTAIRGLTNQS
jgi:uncharacterized protein GlcG (DUF336 family)